MSQKHQHQTGQVWSSLDEESRQEVVTEFRRIVKEIADENFRIDPVSPPAAESRDLHPTVQPKSGDKQSGKSEDAVLRCVIEPSHLVGIPMILTSSTTTWDEVARRPMDASDFKNSSRKSPWGKLES